MRILLALDLREPRAMTQRAEQIAGMLDAELMAVHVMPYASGTVVSPIDPMTGLGGFAPYGVYDPRLEENIARAEEHAFQAFLVERFHCPLRTALRRGDPAEVIIEDAADYDAEMIIVGKRHHSALERLFLGDVAREVVERASCPVLVLPIPDDPA